MFAEIESKSICEKTTDEASNRNPYAMQTVLDAPVVTVAAIDPGIEEMAKYPPWTKLVRIRSK